MTPRNLTRFAFSLAAVIAASIFINTPWFWFPAQNSMNFTLSLLGVTVLCWRVVPGWRFMLSCVVTAAGVLLDLQLSGHALSVNTLLSSLGFGSLWMIGLWAIWTQAERRATLAAGFVGAFLLLCSEYFGIRLLVTTQDAHAKALDLFLYSFDSSLRVPISFLVGQLCDRVWIKVPIILIYTGLFLPVAVVYSGLLKQNRRTALEALSSFVVTAPIGVLFYRLFPALGPVYALPKLFPWHPLSSVQAAHMVVEPITLLGYMNAMPSLHMTWSLLALWWSRSLPLGARLFAVAFSIGTVAATLGTGEHYLVDLVVALPFALAIYRLCAFSRPWSDPVRRDACAYGLLLTLAWLLMLRVGTHAFWISPVIPWAVCIFTAGSVWFFLREPKTADLPAAQSPVAPALSVQHSK